MPKGSRAKKPPVSESDDDSGSEQSSDSPQPPKGRPKNARPRKADPSGARKPSRRTNMPRARESDSDDDAPRKGKARRNGRAPRASKHADADEDDEDDEEEARQPRRRQQRKARSPALDDEPRIPASRRPRRPRGTDPAEDEEARDPPRRRTIRDRSTDPDPDQVPTTSRRANPIGRRFGSPVRQEPTQTEDPADDFETQMRQALAKSLAEPQAKPSADIEEDPAYLDIIERSRREHEEERKKARAAQKLAQKHEAQYKRALKLSEQEPQVPQQQGEDEEFLKVLRLSEQTAAEDVRRAAERMAGQNYTRNTSASWVTNNPRAMERIDGPSGQTSADTPAPASAPRTERAVAENALASVPTAGPSRSTRTTTPTNNDQTVAKRQARSTPQASSQAVTGPRKPPVTIEKLIRMCERAFPKPSEIDLAVAESVASHRLEGMDVDPDQMAQAMAESLRDPNRETPLDITDIGLEDGLRPPDYQASQTHRIVNHFKFTSSDYRREKMGKKWPISKEIFEIMRLWKLLIVYTNEHNPDPKGKGKGKEQPLSLLLGDSIPAAAAASTIDDDSASLDTETSRPPLRTEFTPPSAAAASNIMA
ncbi:MAG: hypothetical protein Q9224_005154, partial [Gallowayella concinna]